MASTATALLRKTPDLRQEIERIRAGLSFRAAQQLQKALGVSLEQLAAVLGCREPLCIGAKRRGAWRKRSQSDWCAINSY